MATPVLWGQVYDARGALYRAFQEFLNVPSAGTFSWLCRAARGYRRLHSQWAAAGYPD